MALKTIVLEKGEYLCREGDPSLALYYVLSGTLRVTKVKNHKEFFKKGRVISGDVVGELSLFDKKRRLYNIKAEQRCKLQVIPYQDILKNVTEMPEWSVALIKTLIAHFRKYYPLVSYEIEAENALEFKASKKVADSKKKVTKP